MLKCLEIMTFGNFIEKESYGVVSKLYTDYDRTNPPAPSFPPSPRFLSCHHCPSIQCSLLTTLLVGSGDDGRWWGE